jgi:TRAP-type C4-dicarboxylate transport system permease small subunit
VARFVNLVIVKLSRMLNLIAAATVGALFLFVAAVVVSRYVLNLPIPGDLEFIIVMTGSVISTSLANVLIVDGHIRIRVITISLPPKVQAVLDIVAYFLGVVMTAIVAYSGLLHAKRVQLTGETIGTTLSLKSGPFVLVMSFGFAVFCLAFLMKLIDSIIKVMHK